jgi:hypothetical protein
LNWSLLISILGYAQFLLVFLNFLGGKRLFNYFCA